jgi:purine-binding chemotaxis protein CheW
VTHDGEVSLLLVRAGLLRCAIPLTAVTEIMRALPLRTLGGLPPYVRGASVIRGTPTSVVDLSVLLGNAPLAEPARYVLVRGASPVALAVDAVAGVQRLPQAALGGLPHLLSDLGREHVSSLGSLDGELVPVLASTLALPDHVLEKLHGALREESAPESAA